MRTTTMNFQGNAVLRKLLPGLELSHGGLSSEHKLPNADHLSELQRIVTSHKVITAKYYFVSSINYGIKSNKLNNIF